MSWKTVSELRPRQAVNSANIAGGKELELLTPSTPTTIVEGMVHEKRYAASVNSRHEFQGGLDKTRLIASKTLLAPHKAISIPSLELIVAAIKL